MGQNFFVHFLCFGEHAVEGELFEGLLAAGLS